MTETSPKKEDTGDSPEELHDADCACGECECACGGECCEGEGFPCTAEQFCVGSACGGCKTYWWGIGILVAVALVAWTAVKVIEVKRMLVYPPAGVPEHSITLSATGKARVSPDTAEVELSVLTEGKAPADVQRDNAVKMNAIVDFVKSAKVDPKDIKTASYSLYPKYEYVKGQSNIIGYTLTQSVRVQVRDLSQVGTLLEGAMERGANQVGDVRYYVDDPDQFKADARREAFEKVRAKAGELARMAGVSLGQITSFAESAGDVPTPIAYDRALGMGAAGAAPAPVLPNTEPGSQDVVVTVTVTYAVR